jgi:hypothetical protein
MNLMKRFFSYTINVAAKNGEEKSFKFYLARRTRIQNRLKKFKTILWLIKKFEEFKDLKAPGITTP